jgi:hypothetical protein
VGAGGGGEAVAGVEDGAELLFAAQLVVGVELLLLLLGEARAGEGLEGAEDEVVPDDAKALADGDNAGGGEEPQGLVDVALR